MAFIRRRHLVGTYSVGGWRAMHVQVSAVRFRLAARRLSRESLAKAAFNACLPSPNAQLHSHRPAPAARTRSRRIQLALVARGPQLGPHLRLSAARAEQGRCTEAILRIRCLRHSRLARRAGEDHDRQSGANTATIVGICADSGAATGQALLSVLKNLGLLVTVQTRESYRSCVVNSLLRATDTPSLAIERPSVSSNRQPDSSVASYAWIQR